MLSLGGGAVLRPENVKAVRETGLLIHLDTPYYRILKNLSYSNTRPLLAGPDKQAETRRLYNCLLYTSPRIRSRASRLKASNCSTRRMRRPACRS